jgi:hypothetical protein
VYVRQADIIPDAPLAENITDDPTLPLGTKAILHSSNIYADLPPEKMAELSPRAGTVTSIEFYDDSQAWLTSEQFPLLNRQMPRFVGSAVISSDGSFTTEVPADRPLIYVLRGATGVAIRYNLSPTNWLEPAESRTASFAHPSLRPGEQVECVGCHRGHMIQPENASEAQSNLARLAVASASSQEDAFYRAAWRVNDGRLSDDYGRFDWASRREQHPWIQLDWAMPIHPTRMVLYPRRAEANAISSATMAFSDGSSISTGPWPADGSPLIVNLNVNKISWARFTVEQGTGLSMGLSEWVVNGPGDVSLPEAPLQAPTGLTVTQGTLLMRWDTAREPYVAGYKVHYGIASGRYTGTLDVGDVTSYVMRGLTSGSTYYLTVSAYSVASADGELSREVSGIVRSPVIKSIYPDRGAAYSETLVTIYGAFFAPEGVKVLIGGQPASSVRILNSRMLMAYTPAHPVEVADVVVMNPDDGKAVVTHGFVYEEPEPDDTPGPTVTQTAIPSPTRRATPTPFPTLTPTWAPPVGTKVPTPTPRR